MNLNINRRKFLEALIAAGASYYLPAAATAAQIDQIWAEAQADPWIFEVDKYGTLIKTGVVEPEVWEDIFDYIVTTEFTDPEAIIREVDGCYPLAAYLNEQLESEILELEGCLDIDPSALTDADAALQVKVNTLKNFRKDCDEQWRDWVEMEGKEGAAKFKELVDFWLSKSIDWMQVDEIPAYSGAQGAAFGFFEDQPVELLRAIGVVIVDGEHPGSTYVAAELRTDIGVANDVAERLGLPFRFKTQE